MKTRCGLILLSCLALAACSRSENVSSYDAEWAKRSKEQLDNYDRQTKQVDANMALAEQQAKRVDALQDKMEGQAKRTDAQQEKFEEQSKRFDRVLAKWEEQARRQDAILEAQERQLGIAK